MKIFNYFRSKFRKIYIWYYEVIKNHNNVKLSFFDKLRAMRYGFSSDHYVIYDLKHNNPKDYISEYVRILTRDINKKYSSLLDNKLVFKEVFGKYLSVPDNIIIILDKMYDEKGNVIDKNNLLKVLHSKKYIIKPLSDTGGGFGVHLLDISENVYYFDGKEEDINGLYDKLVGYKNYIINEFVFQHDYSKQINPSSVNTIRVITLRDSNSGEYIIPCACHRFGSSTSNVVDNASSGGYVTKIDVKTGALLETTSLMKNKFYDYHPDTGEKIRGVIIPNWDFIKKELLNVSKRFSYIPFIAWDIVVTDDGFKVIEGNASSGLTIFQVFGSIKGSKLWNFYKYYGYMK